MSTVWMKEHFITQRKESKDKHKHSFFPLYGKWLWSWRRLCAFYIWKTLTRRKPYKKSSCVTTIHKHSWACTVPPSVAANSLFLPHTVSLAPPPTHRPGEKTFRFLPALWQKPRWRRWSLSQICLRWRLASPGQPWPPSPAPQAALAPASRLSTQMTRKTWGSFNVTTVTVHFIDTHSKKRRIRISVGEFRRVGAEVEMVLPPQGCSGGELWRSL